MKRVSYVCEVLSSIQDSQANHKYITPKYVFYEIASSFERRLNAFLVECLALALSLKEVINQLIDCILDKVYPKHHLHNKYLKWNNVLVL